MKEPTDCYLLCGLMQDEEYTRSLRQSAAQSIYNGSLRGEVGLCCMMSNHVLYGVLRHQAAVIESSITRPNP